MMTPTWAVVTAWTALLFITTTRTEVSVVSRPESITRFVGTSSSFTVSFTGEPAGGIWVKLTPSRIDLTGGSRYIQTVNGLERSLTITSVVLSDGGTYTYSVGSLNPQAMLTVFTRLTNDTSAGGQEGTFETQVTPNEAAEGFWLKDGFRLNIFSTKYTITRTATGRRLVVNNVGIADGGEYTFNLNGVTTSGYLSVRAVITNSMGDVTALAGTSPQMVAFVSPAGVTYGVWRREGVDLTNDNRYTTATLDASQTLTIPNVLTSQAGQYSYTVDESTRQANLTVLGRMDNNTRGVGEIQSFRVNVSPESTNGSWYRNGVLLTNGAKYIITLNTGSLRRLVVQNIQLVDGGEYVYAVNGVESKGYLTVTETAESAEWGQWTGGCELTCGRSAVKTQSRTRSCDNPGGTNCVGPLTQTKRVSCGLRDCPIDGSWQPWQDWTELCLASCGTGVKGILQRERECNEPTSGGKPCFGESLQSRFSICKLPSCYADGGFTEWSQWTNSTCAVTCDIQATKVVSRNRSCTNPAPRGGGTNCTGLYKEFRTVNCLLSTCPIDGGFTEWTGWGPSVCNATCGPDVTTSVSRRRTCTNPPAQNGGRLCSGAYRESRAVNCGFSPCPDASDHLCSNVQRWNDVGYRYHPADCDKYVQCFFNSSGNILGVYRSCPFGFYWNQVTLQCDESWKVTCPLERCTETCAASYKMEGSCRSYWRCEGRKSVARCCSQGFSFFPGHGCRANYYCDDVCPHLYGFREVCAKGPDWTGTATIYNTFVESLGWTSDSCGSGTVFDIAECGCTDQRNCTVTHALDSPSSLSWLRVTNVSINSGIATLVSTSRMYLDTKMTVNTSVSVKLRFREAQAVSGRRILMSSSDCKKGNSLLMTVEDQGIQFSVWSWYGDVTKMTISTQGMARSEWRTVTVDYNGRELSGAVESGRLTYISKVRATNATIMECGLQVGGDASPNTTTAFVGSVDLLQVSRCNPGRTVL
ncbi:uncharacterized protein [Haliotis cracherodii]|uniref:uncharacterized protein isoform X1 n=1 Tax=Haliotis cracherodii TaxID=6455 RepID=UPI0039E917B8